MNARACTQNTFMYRGVDNAKNQYGPPPNNTMLAHGASLKRKVKTFGKIQRHAADGRG